MKRIKDFDSTLLKEIDYSILMFYIVEIKHKEKAEHEIFVKT